MTNQTANPWDLQESSEAAVAAVAVAVAAVAEAAEAAEVPDAFRPNPPTFEYPPEGKKLQKGGQLLTGICERGARVEVLNSNDTHLAWANVYGNRWIYYRDWYAGPKHVKVAQTVGIWYSYPSGLITFEVIEQADVP